MAKCGKGDETTSVKKRHICGSYLIRGYYVYKFKSKYTTEDAADQIKKKRTDSLLYSTLPTLDGWTILQRRKIKDNEEENWGN